MYLSNIEGGSNAISRIKNICNDLNSCTSIISRINDGTYKDNQEPIEFNIDTIPELKECMDLLKDRVTELYKAVISKEDIPTENTTVEQEVTTDDNTAEDKTTVDRTESEDNDETSVEDETSDVSAKSNETANSMDNEAYENLKMAKHVLCDYCGKEHTEECDDCKVLELMNTAAKSMTRHEQSQV